MPNNKSIRQCKWCDEYYCVNCSTHSGFERFCSEECADEDRSIRDEVRERRRVLKEQVIKCHI